MAPPKPALTPLKTPKTVTFPSELFDNRRDPSRRAEGSQTPISPPLAYTEFLKTFSPAFATPSSATGASPQFRFDQSRTSPTSAPSSTISTSFSADDVSRNGSATLPSPALSTTPQSARNLNSLQHLRIPDSAASSSPQSARTIRSPFSPSEWRFQYIESPRSASGDPVSVRQVVRRTITFRYPPALDPPPKGKRRKTSKSPRSP